MRYFRCLSTWFNARDVIIAAALQTGIDNYHPTARTLAAAVGRNKRVARNLLFKINVTTACVQQPAAI